MIKGKLLRLRVSIIISSLCLTLTSAALAEAVATPILSPPAGTYTGEANVVVTCSTLGAVIHYTIGSDPNVMPDPTENDPEFVAGRAVSLDQSTGIKVRAWKTGMMPSEVRSGVYYIAPPKQTGNLVGWGSNSAGESKPPADNDFVAIAAGGYHSLALRADGSIVGWGNNLFGEATPPSGTGFIAIAAGMEHSLALRQSGTIAGWGADWNYQATPPEGGIFKAIAAGGRHSLALRTDGSIVGWGYDYEGQATPPQESGFVAIAAGGRHSLALRADGSIAGWGANNWWDGDKYLYSGQANPPSGTGFVAIAAGDEFSLALRADGSIVGWGSNYGWNGYDYAYIGQATPPSGTGFVAIATGYCHGLALRADGTVVGWGNNSWGQRTIPSDNSYSAIAAGGYHSLAISSDTIAPTPNPMTWSVLPYAGSAESVAMAASTADDASGAEYYFTCVGGPGHDSGWQDSTTYTDTGLQQGNTYRYTVKARDKSPNHNRTAPSPEASITIPTAAPQKVVSPTPPDGSANLFICPELRWSDGGGATWYDVYVGTTPELGPADRKVTRTFEESWRSAVLQYGTTYYWRVDSVNAAGTTTGDVWSFTTQPQTICYIAGHITTSAGSPVIGVTVTTSDGLSYGNGTGEYVIPVPSGWSGTITPSRSGYYFVPAGRSYTNVTATQLEQNYVAELTPVVLDWASPGSGPAGTLVTLVGSNLGATPGHVLFGGVPGAILEWTSTSIVCIVPVGAVTGEVVVQRSDSRVSNTIAFTVIHADVLYVNNSADDEFQYGTRQYPFKSISEAIAAAVDGTVIEVDDGVYTGPGNRGLEMLGKSITVRSANGPASCIIDCNGLDVGFYIHEGEDANTVVEGFTIINGYDGGIGSAVWGSAISCMGASPTIRNCVIRGNSGATAGIYCESSSSSIENCVIAGNESVDCLAGIYLCLSDVAIVNCTIAGNTSAMSAGGVCEDWGLTVITNSIVWGNVPAQISCTLPFVTYCCIQDWTNGGEGNIAADPLFVNASGHNFHLLPDSPCIDAGDPDSDFSLEPWPNGNRVNIGAYGNTAEATRSGEALISASFQVVSKRRVGRTVFDYDCKATLNNNSTQSVRVTQFELTSVPANMSIIDANTSGFGDIGAGESATSEDTCTLRVDRSQAIDASQVTWRVNYEVLGSGQMMQMVSMSELNLEPRVTGDATGNGAVDSADLVLLAEQWLGEPGSPSADIAPETLDGVVNFLDYAVLAGHWLEGASQ